MANKVIIGILVFLVVLSGCLSAYSYLLGQQINALSQQLTGFHQQQAARIDAVDDELTTFRQQSLGMIGTLEEKIDGNSTRIGTLEDEIGGSQARIGALEDDIEGVAAEFHQSVINASKVYQRASRAVVRISNGNSMLGSGFVLDTRGHVVTANHVVAGVSPIYVVLSDGRSLGATLAGSCQYSDVAVLTLDSQPPVIEPPPLADSAAVRIGQSVVTVGNPFDLAETLTSGIVSQTDRFVEIKSGLETLWVANVIQFDAPVNFGNSGGPLLNAEGDIIGLVIARVDPDKGDGIYYAISSNKVKRVATSLIDRGFFDYPWVGVEITNLTPQMAQDRGLETINGVLVSKVRTDTPAELGGIRDDDIIANVDAIAVMDMADLNSYLGEHKSPDQLASFTLIRDSSRVEVSVKLGRRPQ